MKFVSFKGQNKIINPGQKENKDYPEIPVYSDVEQNICVACVELTWYERIKLLLKGRLFIHIHSFAGKMPPVNLTLKIEYE